MTTKNKTKKKSMRKKKNKTLLSRLKKKTRQIDNIKIRRAVSNIKKIIQKRIRILIRGKNQSGGGRYGVNTISKFLNKIWDQLMSILGVKKGKKKTRAEILKEIRVETKETVDGLLSNAEQTEIEHEINRAVSKSNNEKEKQEMRNQIAEQLTAEMKEGGINKLYTPKSPPK